MGRTPSLAIVAVLISSACTGGSGSTPRATAPPSSTTPPYSGPDANAAKILSATVVGLEPSTVITSNSSVWAAHDVGVSRIDPVTGQIEVSATVGGEADVAASGDQVWIDSYSSNAVGQVDVGTNRVTKTTKVGAPTGIAVGEGAVWVMSLRDRLVTRLDPRTGRIVTTIAVKGASRKFPLASVGPRYGPGIAAGAGAVWAVVPFTGELIRVDPSTNQMQTFNVGGRPVGVAVFGDSVWVIDIKPHTVLRIDPSNGKVVATIALPSLPLGIGAGSKSLWVSGSDMIASIDPSTNGLDVRTLGGMWAAGASETSGKLWLSLAVAPDPDKAFYNPDQRVLAIDPSATSNASFPEPLEPATGAIPVAITREVPFTPQLDCLSDQCQPGQLMLDVYAPARQGPWPVVVLAHGGPCGLGCRNYLAKQASVLALDGSVVFNADYRDGTPDLEAPDIACAVNFARSVAADYGGDPSSITLVGHSNGAFQGIDAAVLGDTYHSKCLGTSSSAAPDAFVGVAGGRPDPAFVSGLDVNPHLVVRLVIGTNDGAVSQSDPKFLQEALKQAGYDSTFTLVKGANHFSVFDPGTASPTFGLILMVATIHSSSST